ncbi:hypothetical protein [Methanolapillus millepedarum]|uniref:Uncharacterized protein n=1 Tax=Methanolapillus millepedarum TaxID=3028296 RepID=A0AA96V3Z2_9EURY|nr:hypothetical protein MsAc7_17420 [Methanosarcinaceae archaeon Ac7]
MEIKVRNFTAHPILIFDNENRLIKTYASEGTARIKKEFVERPPIDGVRTISSDFGEIDGLPEKEPNTYLIVSWVVKNSRRDRIDLICPATDPLNAVCGPDGKILGTRAFRM